MKPTIGVVADLNDVYWAGNTQFATDIETWRNLGISSLLLLSGNISRAHTILPVADAAGFSVVCGGMEETNAFTRSELIPDTQAQADAVVAPLAAILSLHPSVEAVLVDDDGEVGRVSRVAKIVDAYRRMLPGVPVVAANVGLNRAGIIQRDIGYDKLLLQAYPGSVYNNEGDMTMEGFGYAGVTLSDYVRTVQKEAEEPVSGPHAPLWIIGQVHNFTPVPPSGFTLRQPTVAEVKQQFTEAWKLGAERIYYFIWHSRNEPTHSWTGLKDLPDHQVAIAEIDGHVGVPHLPVTDFEQSVEDWWDAHVFNPEGQNYRPNVRIPVGSPEYDVTADYSSNLGAAIDAAYADVGRDGHCVLWVEDDTYDLSTVLPSGFTGLAKNNVQLLNKPGTTPTFDGLLRLLPCDEARDYGDWSLANAQNTNTTVDNPDGAGKLSARIVIRDYRLRGWYIRGVRFSNPGAVQNLSFSTVEDCVIDDCIFEGIIRAASGHPGHVTGNCVLENIWFRGCRFRGKFGFEGAGLKPNLAVYLDGLRGGGAISCVFDDDAFSERDLLPLNNDDFSRDYDLDGSIPVAEHRMAQYFVSYGNIGGARYSHIDFTGRQCLVMRYTRTSGTLAFSLVRSDSKSNNIDNPPIAKWKYVYDGSVVKYNDVPGIGGTGYLYRSISQLAGPYQDTIEPEIGQYTVKDNIVRSVGFTRWTIDEGAGSSHIGPNVVTNNTNSGTIPPAVRWEPTLYDYLTPAGVADPLAEALALIAQLEATVGSLNTTLTNISVAVVTAEIARDVAVAEAASLTSDINNARAQWAGLKSFLE